VKVKRLIKNAVFLLKHDHLVVSQSALIQKPARLTIPLEAMHCMLHKKALI
jgi:hypothetical protein